MTKRLIAQSTLFATAMACGLAQSTAALADGGNAAQIKRGAMLVGAAVLLAKALIHQTDLEGPARLETAETAIGPGGRQRR